MPSPSANGSLEFILEEDDAEEVPNAKQASRATNDDVSEGISGVVIKQTTVSTPPRSILDGDPSADVRTPSPPTITQRKRAILDNDGSPSKRHRVADTDSNVSENQLARGKVTRVDAENTSNGIDSSVTTENLAIRSDSKPRAPVQRALVSNDAQCIVSSMEVSISRPQVTPKSREPKRTEVKSSESREQKVKKPKRRSANVFNLSF